MSTFEAATRNAHVIETLENYARADEIADVPQDADEEGERERLQVVYEDESSFWEPILAKPEAAWGKRWRVTDAYVSPWVARVPGLYWKPASKYLRDLAKRHLQSVTEEFHDDGSSSRWNTYEPPGKSRKVSGGVGTLKLAPDDHGNRLVTITCSLNASAGIPGLINDDLWQQFGGLKKLDGQRFYYAKGTWQEMGTAWSSRFPSIRGIPRGYLVIDSFEPTDQAEYGPVQFHPFSVMEYEQGNVRLFDFVYATGYSRDEHGRRDIENFFDHYRKDQGRYGKYLTSADIADPLWDAEYDSPEALRRADPGSKSHLNLLIERVRQSGDGEDQIVGLMTRLLEICDDVRDLQRYSVDIDISKQSWSRSGPLNDVVASFVAEVIEKEKRDDLIARIQKDYPNPK